MAVIYHVRGAEKRTAPDKPDGSLINALIAFSTIWSNAFTQFEGSLIVIGTWNVANCSGLLYL